MAEAEGHRDASYRMEGAEDYPGAVQAERATNMDIPLLKSMLESKGVSATSEDLVVIVSKIKDNGESPNFRRFLEFFCEICDSSILETISMSEAIRFMAKKLQSVQYWSINDVVIWWKYKLPEAAQGCIQLVQDYGITGKNLIALDKVMIEQLGVDKLVAMKIFNHIEALRSESDVGPDNMDRKEGDLKYSDVWKIAMRLESAGEEKELVQLPESVKIDALEMIEDGTHENQILKYLARDNPELEKVLTIFIRNHTTQKAVGFDKNEFELSSKLKKEALEMLADGMPERRILKYLARDKPAVAESLKKFIREQEEEKPKELSDDVKKDVLEMMETGMPEAQIYRFVAREDPVMIQLLQKFILQNTHFPRLKPDVDCQRCVVKSNEKQLDAYLYPSKQVIGQKYRTIMLLGRTGVGKSTLADAFACRLGNLKYKDCFRWKLVNENDIADIDSSKSQTSKITTYYLNDKRDGISDEERCHIRIVDAPGWGDTRGPAADENTRQMFKNAFTNEIDTLDYICLVERAGETRWSAPNKYIFDCILQIFGKDVENRFVVMATFADAMKPNCIDLLEEVKVPFENWFPFNNGALFIPSDTPNKQTGAYWNMCMKSIDEFLKWMTQRNDKPLSLTESRQVMDQREFIYATVKRCKHNIGEGLVQLETCGDMMQDIKKHEKDINEYQSYTYYEDQKITIYEYLGNCSASDSKCVAESCSHHGSYYQMCTRCQKTCCQICPWPDGATTSHCTWFHGGANCPECGDPAKSCPKGFHARTNKLIKHTTKRVPMIFNNKKTAHDKAQSGVSYSTKLLKQQRKKIEKIMNNITTDMETTKDSYAFLQKKALKADIYSNDVYFKQMIETEESTKERGWIKRRDAYKAMLLRNQRIRNANEGLQNKISDLFPQYEELINEMTEKTEKTGGKQDACNIM